MEIWQSLDRHRWWWRGALLLCLIVCLHLMWGRGILDTLIGVAVLVAVFVAFELSPIAFGLPIILWFVLSWLALTVAAVLDLFVSTRHLRRRENRIVLIVLGADVLIVIAYFACAAWIRNT